MNSMNGTPDYSKENDALQFADEVVTYVLNELEGGDWRNKFEAMTFDEKAFFFKAIADGFNDTLKD